jgi:hypothetical protein
MTPAHRAVLVFAVLLTGVLVAGLIAIACGAAALPFVLAASIPAVGLQISVRLARGVPVFALSSRDPNSRGPGSREE